MEPLERTPSDNSIQKSCTSSFAPYNIQPDDISEKEDQVLYSPPRSESSHRHSQRISGTTTPIHDHEAAELLIMNPDVSSTEKKSNDLRQYIRQEIHPVRVNKDKQKMYEGNNVTKRNDRVQYSNSNLRNGTIDNWLKNCQTQNDDISYTPPYIEPDPVNDDEQGRSNFARSPPRYNGRLNSKDSLIPKENYNQSPPQHYNRAGGTYSGVSPQRSGDPLLTPPNQRSGDLLLTPPNNKRSEDPLLTPLNNTFRDTGIQKESPTRTNNLRERPCNDVTKSRNFNQGAQSEDCVMDSDPFVNDVLLDKRGGNEIIDDDIADSMDSVHKRQRIDCMNDNTENVFAPETPRNESEVINSSSLDVNKENNVRSETEVDINSNQLRYQQSQKKEMGARTIAIGQPTIDDLIKSGAVNISDNNNKVNAQLQQLKKKSTNDNRLAVSLTDVLNQELKLKFNKQQILRRNGSAIKCSKVGQSLSCFNKLDYGMWAITRTFNEEFLDILIVHGERFISSVTIHLFSSILI
jgi:hypothetical protein